jgi:hypothetical protein
VEHMRSAELVKLRRRSHYLLRYLMHQARIDYTFALIAGSNTQARRSRTNAPPPQALPSGARKWQAFFTPARATTSKSLRPEHSIILDRARLAVPDDGCLRGPAFRSREARFGSARSEFGNKAIKFGFLIFNQARCGHSRSESRCAREPMGFEMMPSRSM